MTSTNLPTDFPREIATKICEGVHRGMRQLYAPFKHKGENYKLVVMAAGQHDHRGKQHTLRPQWSPNGHIVFCALDSAQELSADLLLQRTQCYLDRGCIMSVSRFEKDGLAWVVTGKAQCVGVEGNTLTIRARYAKRRSMSSTWPPAFLVRSGEIAEYVFVCDLAVVTEGMTTHPGYTLLCYREEGDYLVHFSEWIHGKR